jgi:hypothetical protein
LSSRRGSSIKVRKPPSRALQLLTCTGDKGKVPIYSVHIHPDGSRLATGGIGNTTPHNDAVFSAARADGC